MSPHFALIGAAGYVAPRHIKAIRHSGGELVAALDPHDSVGLLDEWFPDCSFFTEFERFDRHLEKLRRAGTGSRVEYVSICSPNYLHDAHIRFALRIGARAICEKPLVLNPWNLEALAVMEAETGLAIHPVLQLRHHPDLIALRGRYATSANRHQVELTYVTSRGRWYDFSWKGSMEKSGGIVPNIGIHFFDLLIWMFGGVQAQEVHVAEARRQAGCLMLERADVRWFLSIDAQDLPATVNDDARTYRSIRVDDEELEFSPHFSDLHTAVYREVLAGRGFTLRDAAPSIELAHAIRSARALGVQEHSHPAVKR